MIQKVTLVNRETLSLKIFKNYEDKYLMRLSIKYLDNQLYSQTYDLEEKINDKLGNGGIYILMSYYFNKFLKEVDEIALNQYDYLIKNNYKIELL